MSSQSLFGKIALVTGASRGIGAAIAHGLAKEGAHVVLIARTVGGLEEVDDSIQAAGGQATLLPMDLSRLEEVDKIGPTIAERFGALDILVANAGILGTLSPATHIKPQDWDKVMKINFMSNVRLVRTCDPLLQKSDSGRVVFTSSHLAEEMHAYWGSYSASKAAMDAFMKIYAAENLDKNIRINSVYPGAVDTQMLGDAFPGGPDFETKQPEEVVPAYLKLCVPECDHHGTILKL